MKRIRTGFTLMEMLIVIAIIAVLIAIAIPVFSSQLEKNQRSDGPYKCTLCLCTGIHRGTARKFGDHRDG
ncbi:MAG: prepilin-type N-terminal cleavage/methylation domain-containing protein [Vescimonas sp.]